MSSVETFRPAFSGPPATHLAGVPTHNLTLPSPNVSYGLPFPEACALHIRDTFHCAKVFIICSGSLARNTDALQRLISALGETHVVGVRRGMTPHTLWSEIVEIAIQARATEADCLVTLGAGSLTDGAKIVALAIANDVTTTAELEKFSVASLSPPKSVREPSIPLICIPTSLSGGEYFSLAGGTNDATHQKHPFLHSGMGAKLIILDPELCLSTPEFHWLSTGVRSLDHCVEALCCLDATAESDKNAEQGLRLLVPSLLKCKADPSDVEARHRCQMAVIPAMNNIRAGIPMGGSHAIGHQLGPLGVPHGVTSCIMCPAVMKFNAKHAGDRTSITEKQTKVCEILWSEETVADVLKRAGLQRDHADLGDILDVIIRGLGLPRSLKEAGVDSGLIPQLSKHALEDFWAPTNPVPLAKEEQVQEILEMVA